MNDTLELLLHPLAPYIGLTLVLVLSLCLFLQVKFEMRRQAKKWAEERTALQVANLALRGALDDLRREPEPAAAPAVSAAPRVAALNLTRRSQVLRLYHRGEMPEQIAAALGVPLNEVDLLLKVNKMVNEG
ncbi:MAG: hypothetical protein IPJ98_31640 [Bryobacterales bacterium]|nr:hypothetical protein [Bryobacterales bacterium]